MEDLFSSRDSPILLQVLPLVLIHLLDAENVGLGSKAILSAPHLPSATLPCNDNKL